MQWYRLISSLPTRVFWSCLHKSTGRSRLLPMYHRTTYHSLIPWKNCVLLSAAWIFMLWIFLFPSLLLQMNKFWKLTRSPREVRLLPLTVVEMGEQPGDSTVGRGRMAEMTRARQFGMATCKMKKLSQPLVKHSLLRHINLYYVSQ